MAPLEHHEHPEAGVVLVSGLGIRHCLAAGELKTVLGSRLEIRVTDGYTPNVLLETSQEEWPSLAVVGSRSLAGIMCTTPGSVSTKVETASSGPFLVYPHVE